LRQTGIVLFVRKFILIILCFEVDRLLLELLLHFAPHVILLFSQSSLGGLEHLPLKGI
jgi:hypothetical protein